MTAGYCRHEWTTCNDALRAAFPAHAGLERDFRVCRHCLRIEEEAPQAANAAPFEAARSSSKGGTGEGGEQAA